MATQYPPIYWNTARLIVKAEATSFLEEDLEIYEEFDLDNSEEDGEHEIGGQVKYDKLAKALAQIKSVGVSIAPPDINKSKLTFSPNVKTNTIHFGLSGITRVGNAFVQTIFKNRPYSSLEDFIAKTKANKLQVVNLIKAGAFDSFGNREETMHRWLNDVADTKQRLTLQNINMLIREGFLDSIVEPSIVRAIRIYKLSDVFSKYFKEDGIVTTDETGLNYINEFGFESYDLIDGIAQFDWQDWLKWRKKQALPLKQYLEDNQEELLSQVNAKATKHITNKYADGNISYWEVQSLGMYLHKHELQYADYTEWLEKLGIVNFADIPDYPQVAKERKNGFREYKVYPIAVTCIGRDKNKGIVNGITSDGEFVEIKMWKNMFKEYDRQLKTPQGRQETWFKRGNKFLFIGYKENETSFRLKTYADTLFDKSIYLIKEVGAMTSTRGIQDLEAI